MAAVTLDQVNDWAKKSCPRWNNNQVTRRVYRNRYRQAAESYLESHEYKELSLHYQLGNRQLNTYPWPYCDENFADWDESDDPEDYALISDPSSCVIRYATSYCAWKIREVTGSWPQKTSKERLDAKHWVRFLAEAGYAYVLPSDEHLVRDHCYVGIKPDEGKWGLVVWSDSGESSGENPEETPAKSENGSSSALVSSYVNKAFKSWTVDPRDFTWVLIK